MTKTKIEERITRCIQLQRLAFEVETELKEHKAALIQEAEGRAEEHVPTDGGGWSWVHQDAEGNAMRITQPSPKMKGTINGESKTLISIRELAGRAFMHLFIQVPSYRPVEDFRDKAVAHLGRDAKRMIKLVTTESAVQVAFEVKESAS